jgi:hypothetical protein
MKDFIIFSKTRWSEVPRMRHQLTRMLRDLDGRIFFFERPVFSVSNADNFCEVEERIFVGMASQLIHHQIRVNKILQKINAEFEIVSIKKKLPKFHENPVVFNFNYDYFFLRKIFPKNKLITVINDDFVAQARLFRGHHVREALAETCAISDVVLTTAYPLVKQLSAWCHPLLFLPWADAEYCRPVFGENRNIALMWGSINEILDFSLLSDIANRHAHLEFYLVGTLSRSVRRQVNQICSNNRNVKYFPPMDLDSLPLSRIFSGIMPYKSGVGSTEAVTMANKSLRLMSKGLPLIVHGMPNFYRHEAIYRCLDANQFSESINNCAVKFYDLQAPISEFVSKNTKTVRSEFLKLIID